jgi:hypothetical protein
MSIFQKITDLFSQDDTKKVIQAYDDEISRLNGELLLLRLLLSKAHLRDPKTGRLLKKGVMPTSVKGKK